MVKGINTIILSLFCLFISFTSVFAINGVLTVPTILTFVIIVVFFVQLNFYTVKITWDRSDFFLIIFLFFSWLSSFYNNLTWYSPKSINHTLAYSYIIICAYLFLKLAFLNLSYNRRMVYTFIVIGVFISSCFGCAEFFLKNFFDIKLDELLPRYEVQEYDPLVLSEFIRIRAFVEESGHLAFYLELLVPICLLILKRKLCYPFLGTKFFTIFIFVNILAFLLTFSSAGIAIVLLGYTLIFLPNKLLSLTKRIVFSRVGRFKFVLGIILMFFLAVILFFILFDQLQLIYEIFDEVIFGKLSGGSADDRQGRVVTAMNVFYNGEIIYKLIGYGPGAYDKLGILSIVSLYFTYLLEVGYIGLFLFLLFVISIFIKIICRFKRSDRQLFLFSVFCAIVHFMFISNYWYPWFWFVLILVDLISRDIKEIT